MTSKHTAFANKTALFIGIVLFFISINSLAQEAILKEKTEAFFIAFHKKDTSAMKKMMHPNCLLKTISASSKQQKLVETSLSEFLEGIHGIPNQVKFEERIIETQIQTDGLIAHVWTKYEFYLDEKLSHRGINSFQWVFQNNDWKIVNLLDSRRKNE
ncbi:MAG: nuclear transport factor 2 family protein [Flavobacterium sp.]